MQSAIVINSHRYVSRLEMSGSRSHTPDLERGLGGVAAPSPTMHQRIKAIGVPTPIALSSPLRRYFTRDGTLEIIEELDDDSAMVLRSSARAARERQPISKILYFHSIAFGLISSHCNRVSAHTQLTNKREAKITAQVEFLACRRSNPGTPTQPRRPDFIGVAGNGNGVGAGGGTYYEFRGGGGGEGSPQRRFLSEGELLRGGEPPHYSRTNNTVDNIRELAGSPQRGVYTWKNDTSPNAAYASGPPGRTPPYDHHFRSNPTSPTQRGNVGYYQGVQTPRNVVAVYPPPPQQSPQVKRKNPQGGPVTPLTPSDNRRRPMSFVRALEMSDSMEMQATSQDGRRGGTTPTPDRASVYDMNYEISSKYAQIVLNFFVSKHGSIVCYLRTAGFSSFYISQSWVNFYNRVYQLADIKMRAYLMFSSSNHISVVVIGYHHIDKLYTCSTQDEILTGKFLMVKQLKEMVGKLVTVEVKTKNEKGAVVAIDNRTAFVPVTQVTDVKCLKPLDKLKINSKHQGRVLRFDPEKNSILVTLRPTLVNNKPLTDFKHAKRGDSYYGSVASIGEDKITVAFFNALKAEILQENLIEDCRKYSVGTLLKCHVIKEKTGYTPPRFSLVRSVDQMVLSIGSTYKLIVKAKDATGIECLLGEGSTVQN
ncbi:unnamed protein product, partial [Nesidiocoris tenuis]